MKPIASLLSLVTLAGAAFVPSGAMAQTTTARTADYVERRVGGDQVVTFTGDELPADGPSWYGEVVRQPPGVTRLGLIRPRLNFVPELLKSVEAF
jgi:hypothetical protein